MRRLLCRLLKLIWKNMKSKVNTLKNFRKRDNILKIKIARFYFLDLMSTNVFNYYPVIFAKKITN